jgi:hypothetical protein
MLPSQGCIYRITVKQIHYAKWLYLFEVLTAVLVTIQVFWKITPCRLVVPDISKMLAASIFNVEEP